MLSSIFEEFEPFLKCIEEDFVKTTIHESPCYSLVGSERRGLLSLENVDCSLCYLPFKAKRNYSAVATCM